MNTLSTPQVFHSLRQHRLPLLTGLFLLAMLPLEGSASSQARDLLGYLPGEEMVLDSCLRVSVVNLTDRSGPLGEFDWATVSLTNDCPESRRHLHVGLMLMDPEGKAYGTRLWLLNKGEVLQPGGQIISRYAVPDPNDQYPLRWAMRLLSVEKPQLLPVQGQRSAGDKSKKAPPGR